MSAEPSLSVVIATYNRGARIARTIDSVLAQHPAPAEVLIVDDGSPDRTGEWVTAHYPAATHPAVRVLVKENGGTSAARNFGARAVSSPFIMFLDHDDELLPGAIETLTTLFATFPEARAVYADHTYRNTVNGVFHPNHHEAQPAFHRLRAVPVMRAAGDARLYGRPLHQALLAGNLLQQPWAIAKDVFLALGGFAPDIRYCEDWDLYLRVTAAVPVALSDRVISEHLVEGENLHLAPGQEQMHVRVIERQLKGRWTDPRGLLLLRRRLAAYYKKWGDVAGTLSEGRRWYARAFAAWPFDHVVAARLLGLDRGWSARRGVAE